ncbi:hypothetical protein MAR_016572, partial [Mya arenaria]
MAKKRCANWTDKEKATAIVSSELEVNMPSTPTEDYSLYQLYMKQNHLTSHSHQFLVLVPVSPVILQRLLTTVLSMIPQDKQNRLLVTPWCITVLIIPSRCCIRTMPNRSENFSSKHLENVDALESAVNLQVKWRASNAETLEEVADTVRKSSRVGYNIPQYVNNPAKPVTFYNWTEFFRTLFKPIPGLTKYHHFRITSSHPGTVFLREYADNQEVAIEITRPQRQPIPSSDMPERIDNQELDAKRSWYLFEEIAPLCNNSSACSKPTVPKPSSEVESQQKILKIAYKKEMKQT